MGCLHSQTLKRYFDFHSIMVLRLRMLTILIIVSFWGTNGTSPWTAQLPGDLIKCT
jgi:hypothetical protein